MGHRACRARCHQLERLSCRRVQSASCNQGHRAQNFISQHLERTSICMRGLEATKYKDLGVFVFPQLI